jgi:putative DNA primase/helicase
MGISRSLQISVSGNDRIAGGGPVNVETEIAEAMRSFGIMPPRYITFDGKIRRFGPKKSYWYVFFDGHIKAGAFGDWKTGVNEKFIESRQDITPKDRQRIARQMREAAAQRERELRATHVKAAKDCVSVWNNA